MRNFILVTFIFIVQNFNAQNLGWAWADGAGGAQYETSNGMATDEDGNVFITGYFFGSTITFGSITLNNADTDGGSADIFTVKNDADGNANCIKLD